MQRGSTAAPSVMPEAFSSRTEEERETRRRDRLESELIEFGCPVSLMWIAGEIFASGKVDSAKQTHFLSSWTLCFSV